MTPTDRSSETAAGENIDPATVEVIRNRLHDIAQEMQATVMNAAYSPLWQESGDLSCALLNWDCEIMGQSEMAMPIHIATMMNSLSQGIEKTGGFEELRPGDVIFHNDPYSGNNHLPDFLAGRPVYVDETLIGFSAVRGHWVDVGGISPSSYAIDTDEIIKEGIRIPPTKLYRAGDRNEDLLSAILANTRNSEDRRGDLNAQIAGVRQGYERFENLAEKFGIDTLRGATSTILDNEEARMRSRIADLPAGRYEATDHIDAMDGGLLTIRVTVEVDGNELHIDFEGTTDQVEYGINAPPSCTEAAAYYGVKQTINPGFPGTSGEYHPVTVEAPEGSILNPRHPAPVVAGNTETSTRVYDVVMHAISKIDEGLAFGASTGTSNILSYQSLETEQINYTTLPGGTGACPARDGVNGVRSSVGNLGVQPIERTEQEYDFVRVRERSLATDSGGAGRYRGGNGLRRVIDLTDPVELLICSDRINTRPFGMAGGKQASSTVQYYTTPNGERVPLDAKTMVELEAGSHVFLQAPGGGGYGDPKDRPVEDVRADVVAGYVSRKNAREEYGVVIDDESVKREETRELRDEKVD